MLAAIFEIGYTVITIFLLCLFISISLQKNWGRWQEIKWWVLFGIVFNLLSFSWLYTVYPLIWMQGGVAQLIGIGLLHLILSLSSGLPFAVVGYAFFRVRNIPLHRRPLIIASSFVIAEMLRSLVISLLYYGDRTTIDLHFNAGTLGNTLSTTPLVELAYYGGTFALTFFLTYIVYSLLALPFRKALAHFFIIFSIFLLTHFFIPTKAPGKDITIGIVTSQVATRDGDELKRKMLESNKVIAKLITDDKEREDFIVVPEDTRFLSSLTEKEKGLLIKSSEGSLIIDGETISKDDKLATISFFFNTITKDAEWRGKELLLPFNEYIPYFFEAIFSIFIGEELKEYSSSHTYTPVRSGKVLTFNGVKVSTLICSEILSYRMIENLEDERPEVVFFQSRLNVFNNNPLFLMHLRSFSKVAAAQLRSTIISSNNYAPSYIINSRGLIVETIPVSTSYTKVTLTKGGGLSPRSKRFFGFP